MPFWKQNGKRDSKEQRQARELYKREQAESIAALEAGRIPLHAERRLAEQANLDGFFTSDLSTNEHLLTRHAGFEPIGQVMGSSFYRISFRGYYNQTRFSTGELTDFTEAQRASRATAISRLKQEARLLGADGVIGVRLVSRRPEWGYRAIEFTAIGTAVRLKQHVTTAGEPFTSALSGQDFWKLHQAGYVPNEIAFGVCSYYIHSDQQAGAVSNLSRAAWVNQEMRHYTAGFQTARDLAMSRFAHEVKRAGASGAVGVDIDWDIEEIEYEVNDREYVDLLVHFAAVGTAITALPDAEKRTANTLAFYNLKDRTTKSSLL